MAAPPAAWSATSSTTASLTFNRSDDVTYGGTISGTGTLTKQGIGTLTLTGDNSYAGTTTISAGTLAVDGSLAGAVNVQAGAALAGDGAIAGTATVASGARLAPGHGGPGSLSIGQLILGAGSTSQFELNTPGVVNGPGGNDLVQVTGDLSLNGTLSVGGAPAAGYYRLFDYGGSLGGAFSSVTGTGAFTPTVLTNIGGQVNLSLLGPGQQMQFWDGGDQTGNGVVDGGSGTWSAAATNWTGMPGQAGINDQWRGSVGVFAGAAGGAVTVQGNQTFDTLQFSTDGYRLSGGGLAIGPASGTLTVDGGVAATLATPIGGAGKSLLKTGGGTLVLAGANTYTGGTTINAGTLQIGDGGTSGSLMGDIVDNAALVFNRSDAALYGGTISGTGALTQAGSGTLTLTGANSHTGGTTISAGTLQVGNGGTAGSLTGDIVDNAALVFDRSDDVTYGGLVSGSGTLAKQGAGTLTLTSDHAYAGTTTISAGTLQLGNGGTTGSVAGDIVDNGALAFNRSDDVTYGGTIGGSGTIAKRGVGTLTLTGASPFSGAIAVEAGTLLATGSIGGASVDVGAGARLGGTGTVGTTSVGAGATLAPGLGGIGTLTVDGDLFFAPGSVYEADVRPAPTADLVHATGTAALSGGTVQLRTAQGLYLPGSRWTLLSADGGRSGSFDGVVQDMPFVDFALSYGAGSVYLDVLRNDVNFCAVARTVNECAAAEGIESTGAGNGFYDAVAALSDPATIRGAFDLASGEAYASVQTVVQNNSLLLQQAIGDRLRTVSEGAAASAFPMLAYGPGDGEPVPAAGGADRAAWGTVFGVRSDINSDQNAAAIDQSTAGFLLGLDVPVGEAWRLGAFAGFDRTTFDIDDRGSSGDIRSVHAGLYGAGRWDRFGVQAGAAYSRHAIDVDRSVAFPGFADTVTGAQDADTFQLFGEANYRLEAGGATLEPFAGLGWVDTNTHAFSEEGGAAALTGAASTFDTLASTLGLRASTELKAGGFKATIDGMAGWQHAFGDLTPTAEVALTGGDPFVVFGAPIAEDALVVAAGIGVDVSDHAQLGLRFAGRYGDDDSQSSLSALLKAQF